MEIDGFVLTGGASSRMGCDKAFLEFDGEPLALRAASVLSGVASTVTIVGHPVAGLPSVGDVHPSRKSPASIYGLHSALFHCNTEWAAVLSCDMPFVTAELFELLISRTVAQDAEAIVPMQKDGRPQLLAALYRPEPCLRKVEHMLAVGKLRIREIFNTTKIRFVQPAEYGSEDLFINLNTPEDVAAAVDTLTQLQQTP